MTPFVVGNWKMNKTPRDAAAFGAELLSIVADLPDGVEIGLAPAFPALERLGRMLVYTSVRLVAQDVHQEASGAFTGEVSASMLQDLGVTHAIVGHSERRRYHGEDETLLARKMQRLVEHDIAPIYCVGEQLTDRDTGDTERILALQLGALDAFAGEPPKGLVLAYEPVWAIGTGRAATPEMAAETHAFLRRSLVQRYGANAAPIRILYGGSVTPDNAKALFAKDEIGGGLVGGASLKVPDLAALVRAAAVR